MSDQEMEVQDPRQNTFPGEEAIGDSSHPETMETDPNGASTAVGVPHPENREHASREIDGTADVEVPELDDYDEETPDEEAPADPPLDGA